MPSAKKFLSPIVTVSGTVSMRLLISQSRPTVMPESRSQYGQKSVPYSQREAPSTSIGLSQMRRYPALQREETPFGTRPIARQASASSTRRDGTANISSRAMPARMRQLNASSNSQAVASAVSTPHARTASSANTPSGAAKASDKRRRAPSRRVSQASGERSREVSMAGACAAWPAVRAGMPSQHSPAGTRVPRGSDELSAREAPASSTQSLPTPA